MTATRSQGRPAKGDAGISRSEVLSKALKLLDTAGERGMPMRALAKELSVTPMALYRHVGNRNELIAALIEQVFGQLTSEVESDYAPSQQIEMLLNAYCKRAVGHPELILLVFRDRRAFAGPLEDLTKCLRSCLQMTGLTSSEVEHWLACSWTTRTATQFRAGRCGAQRQRNAISRATNITFVC